MKVIRNTDKCHILAKLLIIMNFKSNKLNVSCILSNVNKDKVVICCHGLGSGKSSKTYVRLEDEFKKRNISTLRFDFYGHGESEGNFEKLTLGKAVNNVLDAIKLVKSKGFKEIGLIGASFGGMVALITATKTKEINILALKAPVSNYLAKLVQSKNIKDWKETGIITYYHSDGKDFKLKYDFFKDAEKYDNIDFSKIAIPTLIVHGDNDKDVPLEQSKTVSKVIPNCKLKIIKWADHRFSEHFEEMIEIIVNFIRAKI